jgi:GWxTD domain-containing protein
MKSVKLLLVFIFSAGILCSQPEKSAIYSSKQIKYYHDFLNFMDIDGKTRVDIFFQVPFNEIQFVRTSDGYTGGYSVTVSIYQEDEETLVLEKIWNEKVTSTSFEESSAKENFNLSYRSFNLNPGKYFIKTTVVDKDSRQEYSSSNQYEVKDFSIKPAISDIMFVAQKTVVDGKEKIIPNISRNIYESESSINLFFEVYSDSLSESNIDYAVTNKDENILYSKSDVLSLKKGKTQIFFTINDTSLTIGNYFLTVMLKDSNDNTAASTSKTFYSRWVGLPASVDNIDDAIAQLIYIANPDELEYMKDGENDEQKTTRFLEFWKSKDPSPGNDENEVFEEYFRRVNYTNEQYSHYTEGWKSDRGMVFIILGAPNNIDKHPFDYDQKPYEIWQYYELNYSFTFLDQTGFGDYRLITPMYGDLFRYRY